MNCRTIDQVMADMFGCTVEQGIVEAKAFVDKFDHPVSFLTVLMMAMEFGCEKFNMSVPETMEQLTEISKEIVR